MKVLIAKFIQHFDFQLDPNVSFCDVYEGLLDRKKDFKKDKIVDPAIGKVLDLCSLYLSPNTRTNRFATVSIKVILFTSLRILLTLVAELIFNLFIFSINLGILKSKDGTVCRLSYRRNWSFETTLINVFIRHKYWRSHICPRVVNFMLVRICKIKKGLWITLIFAV